LVVLGSAFGHNRTNAFEKVSQVSVHGGIVLPVNRCQQYQYRAESRLLNSLM